MADPIICPRCAHGHVLYVTIRPLLLDLWLCDECDATWRNSDSISVSTWEDYETLAKSLGVSPLWDKLEVHS